MAQKLKNKKVGVDKKLKEFIKDCGSKASWILGVSNFEVDIYYMEKPKDESREDGAITRAEIFVDRRYLKGDIKIYPTIYEMWKRGEKKEIRSIIYHETAHILTQHMMDLVTAYYKDEGECKDAWEALTESISRLAVRIDEYESKK